MIPEAAVEAAAGGMFAEEQCDRRQKLDVESNWRGRLNDRDRAEYRRLARAALEAAAPHMTSRMISTVEELDVLPFETVIRDGDDCVLERWGDLEESGWVTVMVTSFIPRDQIALPATVIYRPTP